MRWDEMNNGQKLKLGDAPEAPLSSSVKIRSPFKTLYFYCFMHYVFFLERLYFSFQFSFVLFAAINLWITLCVWRETCSIFHLPRTLYFSLLSFQRVFSFSATAFSFHFSPWFVFRSCYIFLLRYIFASDPCWFSSKEVFIKSSNGVGKEKKLYAKKWYKKELV
jgi:hypothetical protein